MRLIAIICMVSLAMVSLFYAGKAAFTGQSYGARTCKTVVWDKGFKGANVTSPCVVSDFQ